MKFYNYLNEKTTFTGIREKDKLLKEMEKWKSDLRKITKIYKSLQVPQEGDKKEVQKWMEFRKIIITFQNNFEKWAFDYVLDKGKKDEQWYEREFRSKAWTAFIQFSTFDLMKDSYATDDARIIHTQDIIKNREKTIQKYNRNFRDAFKAFEDLVNYEETLVDRAKKIEDFNYGGVNISIRKEIEISDFVLKLIEKYIQNLQSWIKKMEKKGLGDVTKNLQVVIDSRSGVSGAAAAEYEMGIDGIRVYTWGMTDNAEEVFYHELGHRIFHKLITKNAQKIWEDFINNTTIQITKTHIDSFVNQFFPVLNKEFLKKTKWESDDWVRLFFIQNKVDIDMIGVYQHLFNLLGHESLSKNTNWSKNDVIDILSDSIGHNINKYFITDYSKKNADEAFSETVKLYMIGTFQKLHPITKEVFKNVVSSSNSLKIYENKNRYHQWLIKMMKDMTKMDGFREKDML